jgi:hypothetical protein
MPSSGSKKGTKASRFPLLKVETQRREESYKQYPVGWNQSATAGGTGYASTGQAQYGGDNSYIMSSVASPGTPASGWPKSATK